MRQVTLLILWFAGSSPTLAGSPPGPAADASCAVTIASAADLSYGNAMLSTYLWPGGVVVFEPGGSGFVTSDDALSMKFPWNRFVDGKLRVTGRRIDGEADPLRFEAPNGYGDTGFQASYLIFPTPGCWEVSAQVGERADSKIEFVTKVVKVGDGPGWRRNVGR
jgi:hypothetical protein